MTPGTFAAKMGALDEIPKMRGQYRSRGYGTSCVIKIDGGSLNPEVSASRAYVIVFDEGGEI